MRHPVDVLEEWVWNGFSLRLALWPSGRLTVQYYDPENGDWFRSRHQVEHLVVFDNRTADMVSFHRGVYN